MSKVVVVIRGGMVEDIYADDSNVVVCVMDTDAGYYGELTEDELRQEIRECLGTDKPRSIY